MAKQLTAWEANDGSLHRTRQDAADQDLRLALRDQGFTEHTIEGIVSKRVVLIRLLRESETPDARDVDHYKTAAELERVPPTLPRPIFDNTQRKD